MHIGIQNQCVVRNALERVHEPADLCDILPRGTSILGEVRNVEIPGPTQQLLCSKYHDFLAVFPLAHSKIKLNILRFK